MGCASFFIFWSFATSFVSVVTGSDSDTAGSGSAFGSAEGVGSGDEDLTVVSAETSD